jgi:hypothetical protein
MLNTYQSRIIYYFGCFFVSFSLNALKINSSVAADRRILKYMSYRPYAINWEEEESINIFVVIKWGKLADIFHIKSLSTDLTVEHGTIIIQTSKTNRSVMMFDVI